MVVVVQLLATDNRCKGHDIGRRVLGLEVAIAPKMSDAIDHTGRQHRDTEHLQRENGNTGKPEQQELDSGQRHHAQHTKAAVQMSLNRVIRRSMTKLVEHGAVRGCLTIELGTFE